MSTARPRPSALGDPVFENIAHDPRRSFYWHTHGFPSPLAKWNFHPEYELHLIRHSYGHYMVGDYAGRFGPGNLVLVGPNLPHCWYSDLANDDTVIEERDVVVQFRGEWLESLMRLCPELRRVETLLNDCERGVLFTGSGARRAGRRLEAMGGQDEVGRVSTLIELLGGLARNDHRLLTTPGYNLRHAGVHSEQVDAILQHIHRHFNRHISMTAVARWQGMTPSTFSRFFKRATGDTFIAFVRRLRIDHACRLLLDPRYSVADVCFMAGYSNLSNFNRHFRRLTGMTPREYRQSPAANKAVATGESTAKPGTAEE
ncbi:AraC family transcriptional regulator [Salinisphaera sp.]|uniref:AraC family transcriptional regulator n=1 Tax=Salinisphaera sp. TaxID=1914330 RepID=UPI002D78D19B|nr:AraC family transcriptional regulator [Salinisphaera sp.]HET7314935.1 AraC family transcriptional regulator [Salinisphaera sp.]